MVQTLMKRLPVVAGLVLVPALLVVSWWAWKGLDDSWQAYRDEIARYETSGALRLVHDLGAELFHLDFTFRLEVSKAVRDGTKDWPSRLDALAKAYQTQAHFPGLLKDLVLVQQEGEGARRWLNWTPRGWVDIPRPDWLPATLSFDQPADPLVDLDTPLWLISLPPQGGSRLVAVHYDVATVVNQIVPALAKDAFTDSQGNPEVAVTVRHGTSGVPPLADLTLPLVPQTKFSSWLQNYLARTPSAPADGPGASGAPSGPRPQWVLDVRLMPRGLAALTWEAQTNNLWAAAGLFCILGAGLGLFFWSIVGLLRAARQQKSFSALVSHELKTPVASIRSLSENLAEGVVTDETKVQQYGSLILEQTHRLGEMVGNILTLSSLELQGASWRREAFDAAELIREAAASQGLPVSIEGTSWTVRGNRAAVRASLDNLVTNALRYGVRDGEAPEVSLGLCRDRRAGVRWIGLMVNDRGPGLTGADRAQLFRPYRRGRVARERQIPGSGIGLTLVKAAMGQLRGRVQVRTRPQGGLCFILWLREGGGA